MRALKTSSPHETLRWSESKISLSFWKFTISHFYRLISRDFSYQSALPWMSSIYIQRKRVGNNNKKRLIFLRWSWLYGKHVRHSVFVSPWNKNGEQNVNHRRKQEFKIASKTLPRTTLKGLVHFFRQGFQGKTSASVGKSISLPPARKSFSTD